ncbi:dihydrofolate reductase family protein [Streptomyces sp. UP1A-1]|nr:dihydrofolate reductase family protein [Streptomyces sp. UP1A-1]
MTRSSPSSPASCDPRARTSTGGACTRRWPSGRRTPPWPRGRTSWPTTPSAWQAADKVVYSSTLAEPSTARTRLERRFDPRAVHDLKATAGGDLLVGGPNLAAQALAAGLVDEIALFVWPIVLGGRNPALPTDARIDLELVDEHRFGNGVVHLRYRVR